MVGWSPDIVFQAVIFFLLNWIIRSFSSCIYFLSDDCEVIYYSLHKMQASNNSLHLSNFDLSSLFLKIHLNTFQCSYTVSTQNLEADPWLWWICHWCHLNVWQSQTLILPLICLYQLVWLEVTTFIASFFLSLPHHLHPSHSSGHQKLLSWLLVIWIS
jgi:hypothetical protein